MATNGGGAGPIEVRCPDFTKRFKTVDDAEAWVGRLTDCHHDHTIARSGDFVSDR